ncbi:MAG: two-component sensor histidine kinase [bacterium]|nr:two-component sensor histidine kinase [bacterium]
MAIYLGLVLAGAAAGACLCAYLMRRRRSPAADPRVAEISELAGGLAHELRNPLSTLMVNLQLLAENLEELDDAEEDTRRRSLLKVEAIRREAERLKHLLDDFLKVAAPSRLEPRDVDLNHLVAELVEFFSPQADAAGVRLRLACAEEPLPCRLDDRLIKQALFNILLNAQQAMPDGGEIMVRTMRGPDRTAGVEVADTGPGLDPAMLDQVLRPFYSTKTGGTGLGLSTTHRIVHAHGGRLELDGEPGRGTAFTIRLPLIDRPR